MNLDSDIGSDSDSVNKTAAPALPALPARNAARSRSPQEGPHPQSKTRTCPCQRTDGGRRRNVSTPAGLLWRVSEM